MKAKRIDTGVVYELNEKYYALYKTEFELVEEAPVKLEDDKVVIEPVVEEIVVAKEVHVEPKKMGRPKK